MLGIHLLLTMQETDKYTSVGTIYVIGVWCNVKENCSNTHIHLNFRNVYYKLSITGVKNNDSSYECVHMFILPYSDRAG